MMCSMKTVSESPLDDASTVLNLSDRMSLLAISTLAAAVSVLATPAVTAGRPLTESERELRADIKMAADRGDWDLPE